MHLNEYRANVFFHPLEHPSRFWKQGHDAFLFAFADYSEVGFHITTTIGMV
jgi:hypothetical protein